MLGSMPHTVLVLVLSWLRLPPRPHPRNRVHRHPMHVALRQLLIGELVMRHRHDIDGIPHLLLIYMAHGMPDAVFTGPLNAAIEADVIAAEGQHPVNPAADMLTLTLRQRSPLTASQSLR